MPQEERQTQRQNSIEVQSATHSLDALFELLGWGEDVERRPHIVGNGAQTKLVHYDAAVIGQLDHVDRYKNSRENHSEAANSLKIPHD